MPKINDIININVGEFMDEILKQTYRLVDYLKETPEYIALYELNEQIQIKYGNEIKIFQETFEKFEQALKIGKDYYPNFKEVANKYQQAKTVLYEKDEVRKYFNLENELNKKLEIVSSELLKAVSNYSDVKGAFCKWK